MCVRGGGKGRCLFVCGLLPAGHHEHPGEAEAAAAARRRGEEEAAEALPGPLPVGAASLFPLASRHPSRCQLLARTRGVRMRMWTRMSG